MISTNALSCIILLQGEEFKMIFKKCYIFYILSAKDLILHSDFFHRYNCRAIWVLVWKSRKEISAICVYTLWTENFLCLERAYSPVVHMTSERTWTHEIMKCGSMKKISSQLAISTDITLELVRGCIGIFNNVLADGKKTRFKSKDIPYFIPLTVKLTYRLIDSLGLTSIPFIGETHLCNSMWSDGCQS